MNPRPSVAIGERGFTLAEMLVVLAIVALTTASLVPLVARTRSAFSLRTVAELIAADLRDVRSAAIAAGAPREILIAPAERTISSGGLTPNRRLPAGVTIATNRTPAAGDRVAVRFAPDGATAPLLMSLSDGRATLSLVIAAGTGVAQVVAP